MNTKIGTYFCEAGCVLHSTHHYKAFVNCWHPVAESKLLLQPSPNDNNLSEDDGVQVNFGAYAV